VEKNTKRARTDLKVVGLEILTKLIYFELD